MSNILFPTAGSQKVQNIWNTSHSLVDEGAFFLATNPAPGTPIATTTSVVDAGNAGATSAQTRPVSIIYNPWAPSDPGAKAIYLQYWWWFLTTAPATTTVWDMAIWMEPIGSSAYTSAGSLIVPVQANPGVSATTRAKIYFGALVAAATTTGGTLLSRRRIQSSVPVVLDEWVMTFGDKVQPTNLLSGGASVKRFNVALPPLIIPPGYAAKVGMWGSGNTAAPAWEFEMGYVERVPGL